jgi:hypothetical protein
MLICTAIMMIPTKIGAASSIRAPLLLTSTSPPDATVNRMSIVIESNPSAIGQYKWIDNTCLWSYCDTSSTSCQVVSTTVTDWLRYQYSLSSKNPDLVIRQCAINFDNSAIDLTITETDNIDIIRISAPVSRPVVHLGLNNDVIFIDDGSVTPMTQIKNTYPSSSTLSTGAKLVLELAQNPHLAFLHDTTSQSDLYMSSGEVSLSALPPLGGRPCVIVNKDLGSDETFVTMPASCSFLDNGDDDDMDPTTAFQPTIGGLYSTAPSIVNSGITPINLDASMPVSLVTTNDKQRDSFILKAIDELAGNILKQPTIAVLHSLF